jgi:hypothetical protein
MNDDVTQNDLITAAGLRRGVQPNEQIKQQNVRYWHKADITVASANVWF